MSFAEFVKDPDANLDYEVDWTAWLPDGDTITASLWIVPTGVTKTDEANTTATATVWLSGGTVGTNYDVTNRITTAAGRVDDRTIRIKVKQR